MSEHLHFHKQQHLLYHLVFIVFIIFIAAAFLFKTITTITIAFDKSEIKIFPYVFLVFNNNFFSTVCLIQLPYFCLACVRTLQKKTPSEKHVYVHMALQKQHFQWICSARALNMLFMRIQSVQWNKCASFRSQFSFGIILDFLNFWLILPGTHHTSTNSMKWISPSTRKFVILDKLSCYDDFPGGSCEQNAINLALILIVSFVFETTEHLMRGN